MPSPTAADVAAVADYPDPFAAIVWRDNLMACQFHPEKSQAWAWRCMPISQIRRRGNTRH